MAGYFHLYLGKTATKFIIDNSFASMPLGICASYEEILKHGGQSDVQHDVFNFVKRTYRPNVLSSYRLKRSSRFTLHSSLFQINQQIIYLIYFIFHL